MAFTTTSSAMKQRRIAQTLHSTIHVRLNRYTIVHPKQNWTNQFTILSIICAWRPSSYARTHKCGRFIPDVIVLLLLKCIRSIFQQFCIKMLKVRIRKSNITMVLVNYTTDLRVHVYGKVHNSTLAPTPFIHLLLLRVHDN